MSQSTRETQTWRKRSRFAQLFKQLGPLGPLGLQVLEVQQKASDSSQAELTSPASAVVCIRWAWSDFGSDWILCILNFHLALARIFPCDKYHDDPCFLHVKVPVLRNFNNVFSGSAAVLMALGMAVALAGERQVVQVNSDLDKLWRSWSLQVRQAAFGRRCGQLMLRVLLQHIATHLQRNTSDYWRYRGNLGQVLQALHVLQKSPASDTFR